jgi:hypothetical protein
MNDVKTRGSVVVPIGGMWEYTAWEIQFDVDISEYSGTEPCPHCHTFHVESVTRYDGIVNKTKHWTCPRVVVATNEGGNNTTGICLDCLLAAVEKLA